MKQYLFTASSLATMFNFEPTDDWPDHPGPGGPVIRQFADRLAWAMLNPQPLPPVAGPQPDPWRYARVSRAAIDTAIVESRFAEVAGQKDGARGVVQSHLLEVIDDICGTRVPGRPRPPHHIPAATSALQLFVAGAQFQTASENGGALQSVFSAAAERLFDAGMKQMETASAAGAA